MNRQMEMLRGFQSVNESAHTSSGALAKLVGKDTEHKTRLHSRRGMLVTYGELRSLLPSLRDRLSRRVPTTPWLTPSAVAALSAELRHDDVLLELGGGVSTSWFAQRVEHVASVEPDPLWAQRIRDMVRDRDNVTLLQMSVRRALQEVPRHPTAVLVDHDPKEDDLTRPEAVSEVVALFGATVRLIVLDDSDRQDFRSVEPLLHQLGFSSVRHGGFRPHPLHLTETTIFVRDA